MPAGPRLTSVETVHDRGSWLFSFEDAHGIADEALLVPCEDGVEAWRNRCTHEDFRLDRGDGVIYRDDEIVCAKHGSTFDRCSGYCDNGDAKDTTLPGVDVTCEGGDVYLDDDRLTFLHEGSLADGDGGDDDGSGDDGLPGSTSHLGF